MARRSSPSELSESRRRGGRGRVAAVPPVGVERAEVVASRSLPSRGVDAASRGARDRLALAPPSPRRVTFSSISRESKLVDRSRSTAYCLVNLFLIFLLLSQVLLRKNHNYLGLLCTQNSSP